MPTGSQLRDNALRARIRQLTDIGRLPVLLPDTIYASYGSGMKCHACDQPITQNQIEYDIANPPLKLHLGCHTLWQMECSERTRQQAGEVPVPEIPRREASGRRK
jgi:hypothetical protein